MAFVGYIVGALTGFLIAFLIGATPLGVVGFAVFGVISAVLGMAKIAAEETFYWIMLAATLIFLVLVFSGLPIPRFLVALPLVLMLTRIVSVWAESFARRMRNS